jgi:hypothetical protein
MWTAQKLIAQACEDAHVPGHIAQGQDKLQLILDTLCYTADSAFARGAYFFPLNPSLVTTFAGFTNFSGPYLFPLDYLRTSGSSGSEGVQSSFFYVFAGVPYQMVPWDLGKMDMQIQQPSQNTFPYAYATDIATETTAQDRLAGTTTAVTTVGSNQIIAGDSSRMQVGMGVAGLGISPGSIILSFGVAGPVVLGTGSGSPLGTGSGSELGAGSGGSNVINLSLPCTGTFSGASIMFGTPPAAYIYPGPSGAFPATLRYQRWMPPLIDFTRIPWYPDQEFLLEKLTASLMSGADDSRRETFFGRAEFLRGKYETFSDDKTSRAQKVVMDSNNFRSAGRRGLHITKDIGW